MARAKKRKRAEREGDPLAPYRKLRSPMPPPEKVIADRRRRIEEEEARREVEERPS